MRFIYKGTTYEFDSDELPFEDAVEFERKALVTIPDLQAGVVPLSSQVIWAMIWSSLHAADPTLSMDDLSGLKYKDFDFLPEADTLGLRVKALTEQLQTLAKQLAADREIDRAVSGELVSAIEAFVGRLTALDLPLTEGGNPAAPPDPPAAAADNATTRPARRKTGRATGSETSGSGTRTSSKTSSGSASSTG